MKHGETETLRNTIDPQAPLLSLLHATRGRAEGALQAKRAWLDAAFDPQAVEHIFAFDCDDAESLARLGSARHVVVPKEGKGCVAAWNLAAAASRGDVLIQMSDDWVPLKHWDRKIIERFRDVSKPGVLKISDARRIDDLLCMAIFTRAWLEALGGEFLSAEYFGVYSDDEFSFRAYEAGVVIDARDLVFQHLHPNYDERLAVDETHRRQNDSARREEGGRVFARRNPEALGRWTHESTDVRVFIPSGHRASSDAAFRSSAIGSQATQLDLKAAREILDAIKASFSWRITAPLRSIVGLVRNIKSPKLQPEKVSLVRQIYQASGPLRFCKRSMDKLRAGVEVRLKSLFHSKGNKHAYNLTVRRRAEGPPISKDVEGWPWIDVSFVTFNSERWIVGLIESLVNQDFPTKKLNVTFVDNGSSDNTLEILENVRKTHGSLFGAFAIQQEKNVGYGQGHHAAISSGRCAWLLISNVDVDFGSGTITTLVSAALGDELGVAGWEARQAPFEHPKHYDPVTRETSWQSHACVLLRRSAYEAVGGYDPLIFMYGEDVELSYRLRSHGYRLRYCPDSVLTHHAYTDANALWKPLQLVGGVVGNSIVRLRYGSTLDKMIGALLLVLRNLFCFGRTRSAAPVLRKESAKVFANLRHFLTGAGPEKAGFPFRFLDYELCREGATWKRIEVSETPLVSIITRTHAGKHREHFLKQAGASVVNQTYKALEWIVVEDSGETRRDVVEGLSSKGHNLLKTVFLTSARGGRSAAGNLGLERCSGDYCMFLDDDDLLYADHVETLYSAIYSGGFKASYTLACEVQTRVEEHGYDELPIGTASLHRQPWDYEVLKDHNFIPIQALLFCRSLFLERGGFDESLDQLEDWNLWLRYGFSNKFGYVPKTTSIFRTPADARERARRQESLHGAYFQAREAAFQAMRQLGLRA